MLRRILAIIGYILVGALLVGTTILLVAYGEGYEFNFHTDKFVLKGLVLINSTPGSAKVTRDGADIHHKTNYRATYNPGDYTFTVSKDGYRTWSKKLGVTAGQVTDARYIVLLPTSLQLSKLSTASAYSLETQSSDQRHIAYVTPATATASESIWTIDLPNGQPQKRFTLPLPTPTAPAETVTHLVWSGDSSRLFVATQSTAGAAYRVMNSDGSNVIDLTTKFASDFATAQFAPTDAKLMFWTTSDGSLRSLDLGAQSISGILATGVDQITFANDHLLYVQTTSLGKTLQSFPVHSTSKISQLIPSLPESSTYAISYGSFQDTDQLVIIPSSTREATFYSGIFGSSPVSTVVARDVDNAVFSPSGRFVAMYSGTHVATYDALVSTPLNIVTSEAPSFSGALTSLNWGDEYHLIMHIGTNAVWADYDGTNAQTLASVADGTAPVTSADYHTAYVVTAGAAVETLEAVALR